MQLPEGYAKIKTREQILEYANKIMAMDEKQFATFLKQRKLEGAFDVEKWNDYVVAISGLDPCPICGALVRPYPLRSSKRLRTYCTFHPIHSIVLSLVPAVKKSLRDAKPNLADEEAINIILGGECQCDNHLFLVDCRECYAKLCKANIERNAPIGS